MLYILIIILFVILHSRKLSLFSPPLIFIVFYLVVIVLSTLYHYYYPNFLKINLFELDFISNKQFMTTLKLFVKMLLSFCIGHLFYILIDTEYRKWLKKKMRINFFVVIQKMQIAKLVKWSYIIVIILTCFYIYIYGEKLFYRSNYQSAFWGDYGQQVAILLTPLSLLSSILSGLVMKEHKLWGIVSFLLICTLSMSTGGRMASFVLLIFGIINILGIKNIQKKTIVLTAFLPIIVMFWGYNISLRGNDAHGLIPYLSFGFDWKRIMSGVIFTIYYSFIYGFYVTSATLFQATISLHDILISLNPLSGSIAGWYDIAPLMRLSQYAPYSSIGELGLIPGIFIFYYFILGILFSYIEKWMLKLIEKQKIFQPLLLLLIISMYIPNSFEYNLRSANRYIYYAFGILILFNWFNRVQNKTLHKKEHKWKY